MRGRSSPRKIAESPFMGIYVEGYTALEQGKSPGLLLHAHICYWLLLLTCGVSSARLSL